jgi:hypothetical protein
MSARVISPDDIRMLDDARVRAQKLVDGLIRQRDELDLPGRGLSPEQIAQGRALIENALRTATRMLVSLEDARRIATSGDSKPDHPNHD